MDHSAAVASLVVSSTVVDPWPRGHLLQEAGPYEAPSANARSNDSRRAGWRHPAADAQSAVGLARGHPPRIAEHPRSDPAHLCASGSASISTGRTSTIAHDRAERSTSARNIQSHAPAFPVPIGRRRGPNLQPEPNRAVDPLLTQGVERHEALAGAHPCPELALNPLGGFRVQSQSLLIACRLGEDLGRGAPTRCAFGLRLGLGTCSCAVNVAYCCWST